MFSLFRKKQHSGKPRAIAFIDYEHWYISYDRLLHAKPDIKGWRSMLAEQYDLREMLFFADFSNDALRQEISRIREVSSSIIETQNTSSRYKKDFTDFIMLDHIYQRAFFAQDIDVFLIFSGDGHFSSAVSFLINRCSKKVGVYGVRDAMSQQLKNTASFFMEIPELDLGNREYYPQIFRSLKNLEEKQTSQKTPQYPTFWGTVDAVAGRVHAPKQDIADALRRLLEHGYLYQSEKTVSSLPKFEKGKKKGQKEPSAAITDQRGDRNGRQAASIATSAQPEKITIKVLYVDWKKVRRDGLFTEDKQ